MVNTRSLYGCNCFYNDSSYKRYNRAHLGGDTLIFNFNYGIQGGCCGGGCGMGFWGGVGMGLGNLFGNLFGNMWGGNMWGGGMAPWNCFWGGGAGGSSKVKDTDDGDSSRRSRRSGSGDDTEYKSINEARKKLQELQYKTTIPTQAELDALEKQINDLTAKDGHNDDDNKEQIRLLKADFDKLKEGKMTTPDGYDILIKGDQITFKVGGKDITASPTDLGKLEELASTEAGRTALKALPQDTARVILTKLGYMDNEAGSTEPKRKSFNGKDYVCGKLSNKCSILILLERAKVVVEVEKNPNAKDQWISGPITNVTVDSDGKISYEVDCSETGMFGNTYKFAQKTKGGNKFGATLIKHNSGTFHKNREYTFTNEKTPLSSNGITTTSGAKKEVED